MSDFATNLIVICLETQAFYVLVEEVVGEKPFEGSKIDEQFDMSGLPDGTYFLTVGTDKLRFSLE